MQITMATEAAVQVHDICTVCALERESAGSCSGAVLLCTHWQPSNCRAIVHASYIAGHHILLIFEANY